MQAGQKVRMQNTFPAACWLQHGQPVPAVLTGTVKRVFKNGKAAVIVNEFSNTSEAAIAHFNIETLTKESHD